MSKKVVVVCSDCGKTIIRYPSDLKGRKNFFCNKICQGRFRSKYFVGKNACNWQGGKVKINCADCGKIVEKFPSDIPESGKVFCNNICRGRWLSKENIGKNHPNYKPRKEVQCLNCPNIFEIEIDSEQKYCSLECYRKTLSSEQRKLEMSIWIKELWNSNPEYRLRMSDIGKARIGENACNWQGGLSFEPYAPEFNEKLKAKIRDRDKHICQLCGEPENGTALAVHHIDYDKKNNKESNLISLHCCDLGCHSRTNGDRDYWTSYFQNILSEKYGYRYKNNNRHIRNEFKGGLLFSIA